MLPHTEEAAESMGNSRQWRVKQSWVEKRLLTHTNPERDAGLLSLHDQHLCLLLWELGLVQVSLGNHRGESILMLWDG